jgi:peptidoglycan/xylan/chitin deacetylase (PgdA/CDA1 family)
MLAVLMFHQVNDINNPAALEKFSAFIEYLAKHYPLVLPGDALAKNKLSFCLTFDDAYFDFYHCVYPLLKKHRIPAVLGVPVKYIQDKTNQLTAERLSIAHGKEMDEGLYQAHAPFCNWEELQEMADSKLVAIASHSYTHCNVAELGVDLTHELLASKELLQQKLNCEVDTFIYPYGKYSACINQSVAQHYRFPMRIGSALNKNWHNTNQVIYRINADGYWQNERRWGLLDTVKYYLKYLSNRLRNK